MSNRKDNFSSRKMCENLLQDISFLQWKLSPTPELDSFWNKQLLEDPLLALEVQKADVYLKKRYFNRYDLSPDEEQQLLARIIESVNQPPVAKARKIPIAIKYAVASCLLILIAIGLYRYVNTTESMRDSQEIIVGNTLQSEDIQFITDGGSSAFKQNVDIVISEQGEVNVKGENGENTQIADAKSTLNKLIVPYGKRSKVFLSDGTVVWLNSGTSVEFPSKFPQNIREIHLNSGEIYVEVAPEKSRQFLVKTSDFDVVVLGTKFNVSAYSGYPKSVILAEGSVKLVSEVAELDLQHNHQAIFAENGGFDTRQVDAEQFISWKNGYLLFQNTPISDVLLHIERYYNISFNIKNEINMRERRCSGKLLLSEDLDDVMNTIARLSSTSYKREGSNISISTNQK